MAEKRQRVIPLPPATRARLAELIQAQRTLQAQIDAIVVTVRDLMGVPEDYMIANLDVGFVPPATDPPAGE